jgi:hypothetical protein
VSSGILGRHPGRVLIVIAAILVVLNLGFWIGRSSDTSEPGRASLPSTIESLSPGPGTQADRRTTITADLRDELTGVLVIDGQRIPEDQLDVPFGNPQGIVSFRPGPDTEFSSFVPGEHTVQVLYWRQDESEPTDPDSYGWRFRATA